LGAWCDCHKVASSFMNQMRFLTLDSHPSEVINRELETSNALSVLVSRIY
jgi:hypothetical protein